MDSSLSEDDLILRLEQAEASDGELGDSTLVGFLAELETLITDVRRPAVADPYVAEPELSQAIEQGRELAKSPPVDTRVEPPAPEDVPSPQPVMLGQYQLLAELGSGGMGKVYKALHTRLDRFVALKVLPPGKIPSRQMVARFNREMRAAGKLQHPHIVAAQDAGEVDGTHFLAMELVDGCDLAALVKHFGPLSIPDGCELARQAAIGLQHIAEHNMVHRDIKPSNLMLARSRDASGTPIVKILDLGLATFQSGHIAPAGELTSTGQVIGTIDYMAPEQGLDAPHQLDIRADLYSLGATLFKLLTGRAPFEDPKYNTTMKRLRALDREVPPNLTELRPDCPAELAALIARLLAKVPADRPVKPSEVAESLAPFAAGADLAALLQQAPVAVTEIAGPLSKTYTPMSTAPVIAESVPAATHAVDGQASAVSAQGASRRRLLTILGGLGIAALLSAVIVVMTDQGTITIEAPDDLLEQVSVSFLRNGTPSGSEFVIKPGVKNEHRIRSGRVEVRLPTDLEDQFELLPKGELVVRRGDRVPLKLTVRRTKDEVVAAPTTVDASGSDDLPGDVSPPIQIDEPPPLNEWLKGRTILTVSQDGSGNYKTIQAAMDALQPGQVVEVLDRGPYRESLNVKAHPTSAVPPDTGLISRVNTVLQLDDWGTATTWHDIAVPAGFRLAGLNFVAPPRQGHFNLTSWGGNPSGLVIEDCCFFNPPKPVDFVAFGQAIFLLNVPDNPQPTSVWIRRCMSDFSFTTMGNGQVNVPEGKAPARVRRCLHPRRGRGHGVRRGQRGHGHRRRAR